MTLLQEITSGPLSAELAEFVTANNDAKIYEILHRKDITALGPCEVIEIQKYLILTGKLLPIETNTDVAALNAVRALQIFHTFNLHEELVFNVVTQILDSLIGINLLNSTDKAVILSLGNRLISRAEQANLTVTYETIAKALRG